MLCRTWSYARYICLLKYKSTIKWLMKYWTMVCTKESKEYLYVYTIVYLKLKLHVFCTFAFRISFTYTFSDLTLQKRSSYFALHFMSYLTILTVFCESSLPIFFFKIVLFLWAQRALNCVKMLCSPLTVYLFYSALSLTQWTCSCK